MSLPTQDAIKALDPLFAEMNAATDDALCAEPTELNDRERALLSLVGDVGQQSLGLPFELHVAAALAAGLTADDLRELLRFVSYDTGYAAALAALHRLTEIEREHGLAGPTGAGHDPDVHGTGSPIPAPMRAAVRALDAPFGDYLDLQSRMRGNMRLLSVRERAFATITIDVLYQTLAESFRAHVTRAFGAGATEDEVRAVVRFAARCGLTRAWRGLRVLNELLTETGSVRG